MTDDLIIRQLPLQYPEERVHLTQFLLRHQLNYEDDIQTAFGLFDYEDRMLGCGCASGNLLKCFAVEPELRGQNALGRLVSALTQERFTAGFYDLFLITRKDNELYFSNCGFFPLVQTPSLSMLEHQPNGPQSFAQPFFLSGDAEKVVGAIVMNCNPFTLGHRYLIEQASAQCDVLHLFVVEEDRSFFPASVRQRMVQDGVSDLPNVRVHPSGPYMISSATFPTYFLKADEDAATLQSELDITLFANRIAPILHITKRFAGEEPFDPTTARYNRAMDAILPRFGIQFIQIPRLEKDGVAISASRVRALLADPHRSNEALSLVPPTTQRYLTDLGREYFD